MGPSSQGRMDKMRFYREKLLRYSTGKYYYYDYVMVYDFDISGIVYKDGLMTSFSSENEWDMEMREWITIISKDYESWISNL